jgi:hypothetical protein
MEDLDLKSLYKVLKKYPWQCKLVEDPNYIHDSHIDLGHPDSESIIHIYENNDVDLHNIYFDMYLWNAGSITPEHLCGSDNMDDIIRKVKYLLYAYLKHKHP